MKDTFTLFTAILIVAALGCGDGSETSETEDTEAVGSVVAFQTSRCKQQQTENESFQEGAPFDTSMYEGLQCIVWESIIEDRVKITLVNFDSVCGAEWEGDASTSSTGDLELTVQNPECSMSGCGPCLFDWLFEVEGLASGSDLDIRLTVDHCPGENTAHFYEGSLPLERFPDGAICRYADWFVLTWPAAPSPGKLHMPCDDRAAFDGTVETVSPCQDGLVCASNGSPDESVCHQQCELDQDCPLPDVLSCQRGMCRPVEGWKPGEEAFHFGLSSQ